MLGLARAALWAVVLLFVPGVISQFEAPKAMVVRVAGVAAIVWVAVEAWRARRAGGGAPRWALQPLDAAVAVWLATEVLSAFVSVSPRISLLGDEPQHEGLLTSLGLAGIYWGLRHAARGRSAGEVARAVLDTALAAIAVASVYAVLQFLGWDPLSWLDTATYAAGDASRFVRPFGTLGHPNVLGLATAAALCASTALALTGAHRPNASLPRRGEHRGLEVWAYAVGAALFAAVTLMTLSRAAWIAAIAGLAFTLLGVTATGAASRRRAGVAIAVLAGITIVAVTVGPGADMVRSRVLELLAPSEGSAGARREIWRSALAMWRDRPWTGQGPDTFGLEFPRFQTPQNWNIEWATTYVHAHSAPLDALATRGALGALAGLAWLGAAALAAWRALARPLPERGLALACAAALVALLASGLFGALGIAAETLGVALAAALAALAMPEAPRPAPRPAGWMPSAAAIAAAALVAVWCLADLAASRALIAAAEWLPRRPGDDATRTVGLVQRALALDPIDDMVAHHACAALLRADLASDPPGVLLDGAEYAARRGIALEPRRSLGFQELGTVLMRRSVLGDTSSVRPALAAFDAAIARAPMNALAMLEAASGLLELGRPDLAAPYAERAARLYPDQPLALAIAERVRAAPPVAPGP